MKAWFVRFLLVAALVLSSAPHVAAAPEGGGNPNGEVGRVVTFSSVTTQSRLLAGGCKTYTQGVRGYSLAGNPIWTYAWNIRWCYNGSTITTVSKWRTVWANLGWSFKRDIADSQSGGAGKSSYWHYAQGDFCLIETYACVAHSYPWVNQTVYGTGSWKGSSGGD